MGFLERAMQNPQSGQPNPARVSGGTPTLSRPAATPAQPALMTGQQGRPAASPATAAAPMAFPKPPEIGGAAGQGPSAAPTLGAGMQGAGPFSPVQPVIQKTTTTTQTTPTAPPPPPAPTPRNFKGMPSRTDLKSLMPGEQAMTPWGPAVADESGNARIQFTPEGEQAYRQAVVAERKKIKLPMGFEALSESLPVTPGRPNFDPFSGRWTQ